MTLFGITHGEIECATGTAAVAGRSNHAFGLQAGKDAVPALVLPADQAVGRYPGLVEIEFKGADGTAAEHIEPADFKTRGVVVDQKQRHALPIMCFGIGLHVDVDDVVLGACAGGPDLLTGDHVFIAVAPRLRAHGANVRAGIRLGH